MAVGTAARIASMASGTAAGGDIGISDSSDVSVAGAGEIVSENAGTQAGGSIMVDSSAIKVDGADSRIASQASASGAGGAVDLTAPTVTVSSSGQIATASTSTATVTGTGGKITIDSPSVNLTTSGSIVTASSGAAAGGEVELRNAAGSMSVIGDSGANSISSTADGTGAGGALIFSASDTVTLDDLPLSSVTLSK